MVDEFSQGEESEGVKQLDDGVARLCAEGWHFCVFHSTVGNWSCLADLNYSYSTVY